MEKISTCVNFQQILHSNNSNNNNIKNVIQTTIEKHNILTVSDINNDIDTKELKDIIINSENILPTEIKNNSNHTKFEIIIQEIFAS